MTCGAGMLGDYAISGLQAAGHEVHAFDLAPPRPEMLSVAPALNSRLAAGCQRVLNVAADQLCTPSDIADIVRREVPGAHIEMGEALSALKRPT